MALKDEIAVFLRTDFAVSMINFQFRSTSITSNWYRVIAYHLESGRLKVKETNQKKGIEAEYHPDKNTIFFRPHFKLNKIQDKMTVVHECTHAIIDYRAIGMHDFAEDEACAFIAAATFSLFSNLTILVPAANFNFPALESIAQKIVIDGQKSVDESEAVVLMGPNPFRQNL